MANKGKKKQIQKIRLYKGEEVPRKSESESLPRVCDFSYTDMILLRKINEIIDILTKTNND